MATPPVQLEQLLYDHVLIDAQSDHEATSWNAADDAVVQVRSALNPLDDSAEEWSLAMWIEVSEQENGPVPPYVFELQCWSVFHVVDAELDRDEAMRLVAVTGGSIVYTSAREYLCMLTARGPWGPYVLPTISFLDAELKPLGQPESNEGRGSDLLESSEEESESAQ